MTSWHKISASPSIGQSDRVINNGGPGLHAKEGRPAVIIVGPPWPRSGTARIFQNQIEFYRDRGYMTIFLCVPLHSSFTETHPDWESLKEGVRDLGADRVEIAPINHARFIFSKYMAWVKHGSRGTALDWVVNTGKSAELANEVARSISDLPVALIHVNHVFTLGFAQRLWHQVRVSRGVPMILETHDIQSHLMHERQEVNPWTHKCDSMDELLRSEIVYLKKPNVLVHCSVDDFDFFSRRLPQNKHVLALPTIDEAFITAVEDAACSAMDPIDLLFVGQSTDINLSAIRWFFEQVWPLISDRKYNLKIVGAIEALVRKRLPEIYQRFQSHFVGPVADLVPFYHSAHCVIAPIVFGTGISIKTVEALALGKPFVGTLKAFRGMPMERIERAGLRGHDNPEAFAEAIVRILSNVCDAASASRAAYDDLFSKQAAFSSRDIALKSATESSATRA